jgi:AcrR family transcriptional regulator
VTGEPYGDQAAQGRSRAALHYHFPAEEELFSALVGPVVEALDRFVEQAESAMILADI